MGEVIYALDWCCDGISGAYRSKEKAVKELIDNQLEYLLDSIKTCEDMETVSEQIASDITYIIENGYLDDVCYITEIKILD